MRGPVVYVTGGGTGREPFGNTLRSGTGVG